MDYWEGDTGILAHIDLMEALGEEHEQIHPKIDDRVEAIVDDFDLCRAPYLKKVSKEP